MSAREWAFFWLGIGSSTVLWFALIRSYVMQQQRRLRDAAYALDVAADVLRIYERALLRIDLYVPRMRPDPYTDFRQYATATIDEVRRRVTTVNDKEVKRRARS